jgi:GNAT superfamily N-acetyltransferase
MVNMRPSEFAIEPEFRLAMVVQISIRVAEPGEVDQLAGTLGRRHCEYFQDRLLWQKNGLGEILIAFREHKPIGAVFLSWVEADEPEVREHLANVPMISHLYVAPGHRHQGVGRSLMRRAEQRLSRRGHKEVLLGVDKSNDVARRLYEWLGYAQPEEAELSNLGAASEPGQPQHSGGEAYDIFVADLHRRSPNWS